MTDEELKQIVKENKQILANIDKKMQRIEKKFVWSSIFGFIKVLIILAPIILGIIYLTPFLKDFIRIYEPIFKNLPVINLQNLEKSDDSSFSGQFEQNIEAFCDPQSRQVMIEQLCN